jgi:hypothetical protein
MSVATSGGHRLGALSPAAEQHRHAGVLVNRQTTTAVRTMVTAITIIIMVMSMIMLADARAGRRSNQPVWAAAQLPWAYARGGLRPSLH